LESGIAVNNYEQVCPIALAMAEPFLDYIDSFYSHNPHRQLFSSDEQRRIGGILKAA